MRFYSHMQLLRIPEDTLTHTSQFSSLQGIHKCSSQSSEASVSLKEAKLLIAQRLIAQSLISDTWEDIPNKIKLKNKGTEPSLRTSLQLFVHPSLMQFRQQLERRLCFGREQTHERPRQEMVPTPSQLHKLEFLHCKPFP